MILQPKTVSWVIVSRIGLRGVFQYCVTRYLIVWPFLGALPFSTVLQSECKRSRSRKAKQSFHNLLKIVFRTWLVYYQVPLMIGEIPISDACHYVDAHDTKTELKRRILFGSPSTNHFCCPQYVYFGHKRTNSPCFQHPHPFIFGCGDLFHSVGCLLMAGKDK